MPKRLAELYIDTTKDSFIDSRSKSTMNFPANSQATAYLNRLATFAIRLYPAEFGTTPLPQRRTAKTIFF